MQPHVVQPQPWQATVIPVVVMLVVFALRWRSIRRVRRLSVGRLWVLPAIYAAVAVALFVEFPPAPMGWLWTALAALAGAAIGWQRGRMMRISIDPDTQELRQQGSPAAFVLLVILVLLRQFGRYEPGHLLLEAAWADAKARMTDVGRLGRLLDTAAERIEHVDLDRVSPLAVPVLVLIGRERVAAGTVDDALLIEAEALVAEAMAGAVAINHPV